jgi:copper(I)-binding protein
MTRFLSAAGLAAALALCPFAAAAEHLEGLHVHDAYVRTMGRAGGSGAVFMVIHNNSETDDRLIAAASDAAEAVELHTHVSGADGVMQMVAVPEGFPIPAGGFHALERGGDHVMLLGLTRALGDGDIVTLTLTFESGTVLTVEALVDNARAPAGGGHGHDQGRGHGHGHGHGGGG